MQGGFGSVKKQREFWEGFAKHLEGTGIPQQQPSERSHCYVPLGTSAAKIVLTAPTGTGGLACKLAIAGSRTDRARAAAIFRALHQQRDAIEAELGFSVDWGSGQSETRVYRLGREEIASRSDWPAAYEWLASSVTRFRAVFAPRIERILDDLGPPAERRRRDRVRRAQLPGVSPDAAPVISVAPESTKVTEKRNLARSAPRALVSAGDALAAVERLGAWSDWMPLAEAVAAAPLLPGIYLARLGRDGPIVYVGKAGERRGGGRAQGIRGRLSAYYSGKGLVSGLGEAAFDRALADQEWLRHQLAELERGGPRRAKLWGREAVARANIHVRWLICDGPAAATLMERECQRFLARSSLWNRQV